MVPDIALKDPKDVVVRQEYIDKIVGSKVEEHNKVVAQLNRGDITDRLRATSLSASDAYVVRPTVAAQSIPTTTPQSQQNQQRGSTPVPVQRQVEDILRSSPRGP